jgi:hypothetical protein
MRKLLKLRVISDSYQPKIEFVPQLLISTLVSNIIEIYFGDNKYMQRPPDYELILFIFRSNEEQQATEKLFTTLSTD